jgi:hypothetical protein
MAAIRGVVVGREGQSLVIKLETGPTINWLGNGKVDVFDNVFVGFNHYTREFVSMQKATDGVDPADPDDDEPEEDDQIIEVDDSPDYGVL